MAPNNSIFDRFAGPRGDALTVDALVSQQIIFGNRKAATELFEVGQISFYRNEETLVFEDSWTNEIIFILAGCVDVKITGFKVAERRAGQHVGEMALIDPSMPRSATIVSRSESVGLVVKEEDFVKIAARYPDMWRQIAKEIADRLRQRKAFVRPSNPVPFIFVACASESLPVAEAFREQLVSDEVVVELWTDGVFKPSQGTMEALESRLSTADFTVAIFSADDKIKSRGSEHFAPRDNTVFELGLFAGSIGRERSFFAIQKEEDIKVPSDLAGITSLRFGWSDANEIDVVEACKQIDERVSTLGPR